MALENISIHLGEIERILKQTAVNLKDNPELKKKKEQLRVINRSISQWRKKGIPVPREMNDVRNSLVAQIKQHSLPGEDLQEMYDKALGIIVELGRICKRSPRKDLHRMAKERRGQETGFDTLAKVLVNVLEKMGGSGKEKVIFQMVQENLQGELTEVDTECPKGKTARWQSNLRRARKRLIRKGILTPESKGRKWTLVV